MHLFPVAIVICCCIVNTVVTCDVWLLHGRRSEADAPTGLSFAQHITAANQKQLAGVFSIIFAIRIYHFIASHDGLHGYVCYGNQQPSHTSVCPCCHGYRAAHILRTFLLASVRACVCVHVYV